MQKETQKIFVTKTILYEGWVTMPAGLSDDEITESVYDLAESGTWDRIETIETDWEKE
jgi:hypothetical protein